MEKEFIIPDDISDKARELLEEDIETLRVNDMLTDLDFRLLYMLGYQYNELLNAREILNEQGRFDKMKNGYIKPHPALKVESDKSIQITKILEMLGLSRKVRKEMKRSKSEVEKKSPLEKFLEKQSA